MQVLLEAVINRKATIGVIGLGYVGIPVALSFADVGFRVIGVDKNEQRAGDLALGTYPIDGIEPGIRELLARVHPTGRFLSTTDYDPLAACDIVLIDVDTPISSDNVPRFATLAAACRSLGRVMKKGAVVIVESTIAPRTIESLVIPALSDASGFRINRDFWVGHCPERVMPGKLLHNLHNLSRVCGGSTAEVSRLMVELYRHVVRGDLDETDIVTAELVKAAENTHRDINIAFANELGLVCESAGADFMRVRELVNKSPGRNVLLAGAGVGGHCIPKDSWLLVHGSPLARGGMIAASRATNEAMPLHVGHLVEDALLEAGRAIAGAEILMLGFSYLENSDDTRHTPSEALLQHLENWGANVTVHDPWVHAYHGDPCALARGKDAVVLMVAHDQYRELDWPELIKAMRGRVVVDGRHMMKTETAKALGVIFRAVGRGTSKPSPVQP